MKPFETFSSKVVRIAEDDIDTDQMVPARFLRTSESKGLADCLFHDRRFAADGTILDFPLNPPRYQGERIIIAGDNFGCGSSREHAPWAFKDFGIDAIIAPSFGDIFYNNCLKNALLAIVVDKATHALLLTALDEPMTVDLEEQSLRAGTLHCSFHIDPFARFCLLRGFNQFSYITESEADIASFEQSNKSRITPISGLSPSH